MTSELQRRDVLVDAVRVPEGRTRKDMGDLDALAASMREVGLLEPIGIDAAGWLKYGERRLRAARLLGWATIPAVVTDAPSLRAERDENEVRKDFTPSERVEMARLIAAQIPERRGRPTEGVEIVDNYPQIDVPPGEKTRDFVAKQAGFGSDFAYRQAEKVLADGDPDLVEAMDRGDLSISAAAEVARLPRPQQKKAVKAVKEGVKPREAVAKAKKTESQEEVRDRLGRVVPPRLRDVFADGAVPELVGRIRDWLGLLSSEAVARAISKRAPAYPYLDATVAAGHVAEAAAELEAAASYVEANLPHAVCPECDGAGFREGDGNCDGCRASGYVTLWRLEELKLENRA